MNYTQLTLIGLGLFGVLLHNLVELNKLNKASKGSLSIAQYLKAEVYSILVSVCLAVATSFVGKEIEVALEKVGYEWLLGVAYITIGYMGQSLLVFVMGKASKVLAKQDEDQK